MVDAIVNWVEKKRAPGAGRRQRAHHAGREPPAVCPFPEHAHYNGSGDDKPAANYSMHGVMTK